MKQNVPSRWHASALMSAVAIAKVDAAVCRIIFVCVLAVVQHTAIGQHLRRDWVAETVPESYPERTLNKVVTDAAGNSYTTGTATEFTSNAYVTIKYDPDGTMLWRRLHDDPMAEREEAVDIAVDADGNVYVTGTIETGASANRREIMTLKYNSDGLLLWAERYSACQPTEAVFITLNNTTGDVLVTGTGRCSRMVVVCYTRDGTFRWNQGSFTTSEIDRPTDVKVDSFGDVYVTGPTALGGIGGPVVVTKTMKIHPDGTLAWIKNMACPPRDGDDAFVRGVLKVAMALDNAGTVFLLVQRLKTFTVLKHVEGGESSVFLDFPDDDVEGERKFEARDIFWRNNELYLSFHNNATIHYLRKFNAVTGTQLWRVDQRFGFAIPRVPPKKVQMAMDDANNIYLGVDLYHESTFELVSYARFGNERWRYRGARATYDQLQFVSMAVHSIDNLFLLGYNGHPLPHNYFVGKYYIVPRPDPDDPDPVGILPYGARRYVYFQMGAYAPERDWCWTGVGTIWDVWCPAFPLCPEPPVQASLMENGKPVWQKEFTKPSSFTLPVDDKLPRTLSIAVAEDKTFQDMIVLRDNLVHAGIASVVMGMKPEVNLLDLNVETDNGKSVPFTMTLLNKDGKEIWQSYFVAPLQKQLHEYTNDVGVTLVLSAVQTGVSLNYYPNPFTDKFTVMLDAPTAEVAVYSIQGEKIIQETTTAAGPHTLNLSNQKAGLYVLVVKMNGKEIKKLVELKH